jgi:glycosyltransferase involved in cell wall biosynthesis
LVINKTKPSFIGCGRLSEQKNFAMLIRAFAKVRQQRDASLIILGEGPQREMLEQLAATVGVKDDVHLPGFQANPFAWFSKSDAFVLSSKSEGLANVVIEAMATGARMICTDCPSGPSEILAKGKYGVLVPVDGEDAMANAMLDVLDGKGAQLPQAEVQAYLDGTFSFALMIGGYLKVAADVAGDGVV